jgi:hypothetical protein
LTGIFQSKHHRCPDRPIILPHSVYRHINYTLTYFSLFLRKPVWSPEPLWPPGELSEKDSCPKTLCTQEAAGDPGELRLRWKGEQNGQDKLHAHLNQGSRG